MIKSIPAYNVLQTGSLDRQHIKWRRVTLHRRARRRQFLENFQS